MFHHIAIVVLSFLFSSRNINVPDTDSYMDMYREGTSFYGVEEGFLKLCEFFSDAGFSFAMFIFVLSLVMLEIWYFCTYFLFKKANTGVLAILMISYFGIYYYGVVLRSAIVITLCYIGITLLFSNINRVLSLIIFYLIILLAFQFHMSAVFFCLAPILLIKIDTRIQYIIAISSLFLLFFNNFFPLKAYVEQVIGFLDLYRFDYFLNRDLDSGRVSVRSLLYCFISIYIVYVNSKTKGLDEEQVKLNNFFINIYIFGALINSLVCELPAASRLPMNWLFFEYAVIYNAVQNYQHYSKRTKKCIYFLYVAVLYFSLLHSFPLFLNY